VLGRAADLHPLVDFVFLEFPKTTYTMSEHTMFINPLINGVDADSEVLANLGY